MRQTNIRRKKYSSNYPDFTKEILSSDEGHKILNCVQCGACSGSCPVFKAMDCPPRRIFAMIREGMRDEVLLSLTPWICASCYKCTVNCPAQISITDVMYRLKRMCLEEQLITMKSDASRFYLIFLDQVKKYGRSYELGLMLRYMVFHHPGKLIRQVPRGVKMMISGSLPLFPHRIRNARAFHNMAMNALKFDNKSM